jgi:branched-subunit amino acid transport protein
MTDTLIWTIIIGMACANFVLRFVPIAIVSRLELPAPVMRWLSFVPASVMGSLVALEVLRPGGAWSNPITSPYFLAALPTAAIYWRTRSFMGATLFGMLSFVALRFLLG